MAYADRRWIMDEGQQQQSQQQQQHTRHEHQFSWGQVAAHVVEREGHLQSVVLFSDSLAYQLLDEARAHPTNVCSQPGIVVTRQTALAMFVPTQPAHVNMACELHTWFASTG